MSNSIDFRSNQIQTGRLIVASGSGQSSNCLVVYGINVEGSPANQGIIDPTQFNTMSIGTDTFFFVSGTVGDRGTINPTVSVFGGDVHISGNLTIDGTGGGGGGDTYWTSTVNNAIYTTGSAAATVFIASTGVIVTGSYIQANPGGSSLASSAAGFAQGYNVQAQGSYSHAEGEVTVAGGLACHAEGEGTTAGGRAAHAEGWYSVTNGQCSHAEGHGTNAGTFYNDGLASHAEGYGTTTVGAYSHAEGYGSIAYGSATHAGGLYTIASGSDSPAATPAFSQTAYGKYNQRNNTTSLFVVGDGTGNSDALRHDILRVESGSVQVTGSLIATGITGSISGTVGGLPFIVGGTNITANYNTSGQWAITGSSGGAATTMGHSWERPDPVTAGIGAVFINTDDGGEYISSGTAATNGVPLSGWMRRLPSGMAPTRAALRSSNNPTVVLAITTDKIVLSPLTTNNCSFAMHYYWNGNTAAVPSYTDTLLNYGQNISFSDGAAAYYYQAGGTGPIYLALHTNGASTYIGAAVPAVAGYNTLVFAPVTEKGSHYWRWSYNGSAAVDTPMTNPYVGPSAYNYFQAWGRGDNVLYFGGKGIDMAVWTTLLDGADMAILSNPPAGTYGLLETANTGPAVIRIEANRFDPAVGVAPNNGFPLQSMPIRGSGNPANVYNYTEKVNIP